MNMKKEVITSDTHPYLIKIIHAYQPTEIPAREDLMLKNSTMPQTTGWLNLKDLCKQMGVQYDEEIERRRDVSELMGQTTYKNIIEGELA